MKKTFLTIALCIAALTASAQLKSVDVKWSYRGLDNGLGVGVTYALGDKFEFAPNVSLYLPRSKTFVYTAEADLHYLWEEIVEHLDLYPLFGIGLYHRSTEDEHDDDLRLTYNKVLVNVGGGARWNFNDQWAVFAEEKIQYVNDWSNNFFSAGISYKF